jgi:thiol-disulfide isomerase/thioredoxin
MDFIWLIARLALAIVFATAAVGKFLDLNGSIEAVRNFGLSNRLARPVGLIVPCLEIAAAILLIPVASAFWGALLAAVLLLAFIGGVANTLRKGEAPDCHCFGVIHSEPIGPKTLIRNGVFLAASVLILFGGLHPGSSVIGWLDGETGVVQVLAVLTALTIVAVAVLAWLVLHLLGQNGRLLLRLDELEARPVSVPATNGTATARQPAPAFVGTGLIGDRISLESLRAPGKPILLFFSDPGCGPCNALMPEIGAWQTDLAETTTVAMVTRGSIDDARAKTKPIGLTRVIIESDRSISTAFGSPGTPSAVYIDRDGMVASPIAAGAEKIRSLVSQIRSGSIQPSLAVAPAVQRSAPVGLQPGEPAPDFSLRSKDDDPIGTAELSGSPHVLIFWNPGCGFCQRMMPDLHEWASEFGDRRIDLVLVTSGTPETAAGLDFAGQIAFDQSFATGRLFGASGTPSGILINSDGTIGSALAVGGPAIMEILRAHSTAQAIATE